MSTPLQKRAHIVRSLDSRLKKALMAAHELRRPYQDTITFERNCRNLSAEAQNLAQKAAELLAIDKELGDA